MGSDNELLGLAKNGPEPI